MSISAFAAVLMSAALGFGAALGLAACGDDDRGDVTIQGGTGTSTTATGPSETTPTQTAP